MPSSELDCKFNNILFVLLADRNEIKKIKSDFGEEVKINEENVDLMVKDGLKQAFGKTGGAFEFLVLKVDCNSSTAIIRTESKYKHHIWASFSMVYRYGTVKCRVTVLQVSSFLLSLSASSRNYFQEVFI